MTASTAFLAVQATYQDLGLALFKGEQCVASSIHRGMRTSSSLIPLLRDFLAEQGLSFTDLTFIAADAGPGAFTTLRVIIATLNGLAFGGTMPLVSVSSFEGLVHEARAERVLVLLNAYNSDVYYAYAVQGAIQGSGCAKIDHLPAILAEMKTAEPVLVVGNAVLAYGQLFPLVKEVLPSALPSTLELPSAAAIGAVGLAKWQRGESVTKLEPLYLKELVYRTQKPVAE